MLVLVTIALVTVVAGLSAWWIFNRWSPELAAPRVRLETIQSAIGSHSRLRAWLRDRKDPGALTGMVLTTAVGVVVVGLTAVGVLLLMIRTHRGFASFDLSAARFGATHATPMSTRLLRLVSQLGGAVVIVPATVVFAVVTGWRKHAWRSIVAFLTLCVGGQFLVANLVKAAVQRARPDLAQLTGYSGSSFPSGHATAAAATFAAMALIAGRRRGRSTRSALGALAVALTVMVAATRVLLGVHWLTDVLAGMCLGWSWFALCLIAFGGRLLRFGAPVGAAEIAADRASQRPIEQPMHR